MLPKSVPLPPELPPSPERPIADAGGLGRSLSPSPLFRRFGVLLVLSPLVALLWARWGPVAACAPVVLALFIYFARKSTDCWICDIASWEPESVAKDPFFCKQADLADVLPASTPSEAVEFLSRVNGRTQVSADTVLPKCVVRGTDRFSDHLLEAQKVMFAVTDQLVPRHSDITCVVVTCPRFSPEPSLAAQIIGRYALPVGTENYTLSGMGCASGIAALQLAVHLRHNRAHRKILVVMINTVAQSWYRGEVRSMLLPNCLFRPGGVGLVVGTSGRLRVTQIVRSLTAGECLASAEDEDGLRGLFVSNNVLLASIMAIRANLRYFSPLAIPLRKQVLIRLRGMRSRRGGDAENPHGAWHELSLCFDHVALHCAGRGLLDILEGRLKLSDEQRRFSRSALHRYGNTSAASVFYSLAAMWDQLVPGEKVWLLAWGSGMDVGSCMFQVR